MRQMLVMANWKLHGDHAFNRSLTEGLRKELDTTLSEATAQCVLCPPFPYLSQVGELLDGSPVELGAQDCSHSEQGAYTGEVAARMLGDCGCRWVIVGHSERRQYHQESDALVSAKLQAVLQAGLTPVLCVGETQEQREAGEAEAVVGRQLQGALTDLPDLGAVVLAYEPVWAIGTGLTATPEIAQEMHAHLRASLAAMNPAQAKGIRILYGGSVKAGNAAELFAEADIDGALVGGASLDAASFAAIVKAATD